MSASMADIDADNAGGSIANNAGDAGDAGDVVP